ncbi:ornithine aminotransferase mitochondrial-like [Trifolium medium]|uniref:Ornithine aminotransferase mitochondrial-like n=1 Tax=Trifolium medium TaxID=97028 RepID=A0A392MTY5_9FABA|nr:ornithine aminotransferase mitochondrial-like [Trifolium medium]
MKTKSFVSSFLSYQRTSADEIQQGSKALADVLEIDLPMLKKMKPKDAAPLAGPSACDRCGRVVYG